MPHFAKVTIDTGGMAPHVLVDCGNYTNNVQEMWKAALGRPLTDLDGWQGGDAKEAILTAIEKMDDPRLASMYERLGPKNGVGTLSGAREFLARILSAVSAHPNATVSVAKVVRE